MVGDNCSQFGGPAGNGVSEAVGLPLTWSETKHIVWKTLLHDHGWSFPVISGVQVWLTTATRIVSADYLLPFADSGLAPRDKTKFKRFFVVCVDRNSETVTRREGI